MVLSSDKEAAMLAVQIVKTLSKGDQMRWARFVLSNKFKPNVDSSVYSNHRYEIMNYTLVELKDTIMEYVISKRPKKK